MVAIRGHARHWRVYVALGIALAITLLGHAYGQPNSSAIAGKASDHTGNPPTGAAWKPPTVQIYKASCSAPQSREDAEFCEERKAADAENKSAYWAVWQFWAAVVGIAFIIWTLFFTKRAADGALKAANVAESALRDLEVPFIYPVITTSDITHQINRVSRALGEEKAFGHPSAKFKLTNFGRTPAWLQYVSASFEHLTMMHEKPRLDVYADYVVDAVLASNSATTKEFSKKVGNPISEEAAESIKATNSWLFLYGEVKYADIFGDDWLQPFCLAWHPDRKGFLPWGVERNRRVKITPKRKKHA